jgi:hypothetical protein
LMYPKKKRKSRGVRSGKQGGQVIGPPLPIHFLGNLQFKKSISSLWKFGGTLSCWNSVPSGHSLRIDMRNSSKLSRSLHQSQCNSSMHLGFSI